MLLQSLHATEKPTTGKTNLKHSNGIGVREAVQDHRSLHPIEIHPLDPVHVGLSPVDPVVIHRNAVWPAHALRDDAPRQRPVHVTSVDASPGVPPVCPEHQPGSRQRGYSRSAQSSSSKGSRLAEAEVGMLYIPRLLHHMPFNGELCNSNDLRAAQRLWSCRLCGGSAAAGYLAMNCFGLSELHLQPRPNPRTM